MKLIRRKDLNHLKPQRADYPYAASAIIVDSNQLFVSNEVIEPGKKASAPHFHNKVDELILVIKGTVDANEGDKNVTLSTGDSIFFLANSNELHYIENKSDSIAEVTVIRSAVKTDDTIYLKQ